MKLSLNILQEWLSEFQPEPHIREGKRHLRNVRIISDDIKLSDSTVYLSQVDPGTVMCTNGKDYLLVHAPDLHDVLNSILDAFAYYNDWMEDVREKITRNISIEELLELGYHFLYRQLVIADSTFLIRHVFGKETNSEYQKALDAKLLPFDVLLDINTMQIIRRPNTPTYPVDVPSMGLHTLVSNLFSGAVHRGWLITHSNSETYSRADYDLQDAFVELIEEWLERQPDSRDTMRRSDLIRSLILEEEPDPLLQQRLEVLHWYINDPKQLYVIVPRDKGEDQRYALVRTLEVFNENAFIFQHESSLIYLVNRALLNSQYHDKQLEELILRAGCAAGRSPVFTDILECASNYKAAVSASIYAVTATDKTILGAEEILLPYIKTLINDNTALTLKHPFAETLKAYDKKHNSDLYRTAKSFIRNNCNYVDTARELFIHRSSLIYRIGRIRELTGIDFDKYEDRFLFELFDFLDQPLS